MEWMTEIPDMEAGRGSDTFFLLWVDGRVAVASPGSKY